MGTPNPGARGDGGLSARLAKSEKDLAQLRRLIENPKAAKQAAEPFAGTFGTTTLVATMEQDNDFFGGSRAGAASWTVREPEFSAGSGQNGPAMDLESAAPDVAPVEAGWYSVRLWAQLRWYDAKDSAPDAALIWFYHDSSYVYMENTVPVSMNAGVPGTTSNKGLLMSTSAMFYLKAGEWCRVEFWWAGSAPAEPTALDAVLEFTRMG